MKHLFNDIPQSEKNRILEMHGVKRNLISEDYKPSDFATGDIIKAKHITTNAIIMWKVTDGGATHPTWLGVKLASGLDPKSYEASISPTGNIMTVHIDSKTLRYIILEKGGSSTIPTPSKPKPTTPSKPKTAQACPRQVGKAKELFGGSDINLYNESDVDQTTPVMSQICINTITPISDNKSELTSMGGKFAVISGKNGFVLETDEIENGKPVKFYFECGTGSLVNEDLVKLAIAMNTLSGVQGDMPENLRQENVIAALNKLCSAGKSNFVPKVQNKAFASTDSQLGTNNV